MSKRQKEISGSHRHLGKRINATFEAENAKSPVPTLPDLNVSSHDSEAVLVGLAGIVGAISGRIAWGLSDRLGSVSLSVGLEVMLLTLLLGLPIIYKERDNKINVANEKLSQYEQLLEARQMFLIAKTASEVGIPTKVVNHFLLTQRASAST